MVFGGIIEILRQEEQEQDFMGLIMRVFGLGLIGGPRRERGPRVFSGIPNFVEETVPGYSDVYFKKHFRMDRDAFQVSYLL